MKEYQNLHIAPLNKGGWGDLPIRQLGTVAAFGISLTRCFAIASASVLGAIAFSGSNALAQITIDGTLAPARQLNGPVYDILPTDGQRAGNNLFYSFGSFSIQNGEIANFLNSTDISNILSRVTGGEMSKIDGIIQAQGSANLFLMNPSGIIFGPNARLDIGGSFVGTTANKIGLLGDGEFSMDSPVNPSDTLLRVNPSALIFNQIPGPIIVQSKAPNLANPSLVDGLKVPDGQNLFLVGGEVRLENGGTIRAPGGRIELGGLAEAGEAKIEEITEGSNPALNFPAVGLTFPEDVERTDVILSNGAIVDVTGQDGGDIGINAKNVRLSGDSNVCAGIGANSLDCPGGANFPGSTGSEAGNIVINATGEVTLSQSSRIANTVNEEAMGNPNNIFEAIAQFTATGDPSVIFGSIFITTESLSITDGASVSTSTFGMGNAGLLYVEADSVSISGSLGDEPSRLASAVGISKAQGDAGGIIVVTESFSLSNGGLVNAGTFGTGSSGVVSIGADSVSIDNARITSNVEAGATGNALGIAIEADSISLSNAAEVLSSTSGTGNAGKVILQTNGGIISLDDSSVFSNVEYGGVGAGGEIEIETGSLFLLNGSQIQTLVRGAKDNLAPGEGNAGTVKITASEEIELSGASRTQFDSQGRGLPSAIFSAVNEGVNGNAGNIEITAESISLSDRARIDTNLLGSGTPGTIFLDIEDSISLTTGANIQSVIGQKAEATLGTIPYEITDDELDDEASNTKTGSILISTEELSLKDDSYIDASSFGRGDAGAVIVLAEDDVSLEDGSFMFSQAASGATANAGGIFMVAKSLYLTDEATVSVSSLGQGEAGGVLILAQEDIILRDEGLIAALSASGQGGNVFLTSGDFLLLLDESQIRTDAFNLNNPNGTGGNIFAVTKYLIAAPYNTNDIIANAIQDVGGEIFVLAARLYDIEERTAVDPTNDIDASSEFDVDGTVSAFDLNTDPTQGFTNLPGNLIDPSSLIAETCAPRGSIANRPKNQFINTQQGGLPPDPNAAFPGEAVVNELEVPEENQENTPEEENSTGEPSSANPTNLPPVETASSQEPTFVEAQGWVYGENGTVLFTAQAPTVTPTTPALTPASTCNNVETSLLPR